MPPNKKDDISMYKKVLFPQQAACLGCVEAHNKNIFYVSSLNREIILRGWASPFVHLSGLLAYSWNLLYAAFETWLIKSNHFYWSMEQLRLL